jgi:hypothetical protein
VKAIATHFVLVSVAAGIALGYVTLFAAEKVAERLGKKLTDRKGAAS